MRNPRYYIDFGYVNESLSHFGKVEPKLLTFSEIDYFLKILSPFDSIGWLNNVRNLRRNGSIFIKITDFNNNVGKFFKIIKITRN